MKLVETILDGGALEMVFDDHLLSDLVDVDDGVGVSGHLKRKEVV